MLHSLRAMAKYDGKGNLRSVPSSIQDLKGMWKEAKTKTGETYYYHTTTRETRWEEPKDSEKDSTTKGGERAFIGIGRTLFCFRE